MFVIVSLQFNQDFYVYKAKKEIARECVFRFWKFRVSSVEHFACYGVVVASPHSSSGLLNTLMEHNSSKSAQEILVHKPDSQQLEPSFCACADVWVLFFPPCCL